MGLHPAPGARVYVVTLGCPKNEADSRGVIRFLRSAGVVVVDRPEDATHILLNTCGFIQEAKEESIGAILDACATFPDKQVLVMGCLVERYREELAEGIPEVAGWFGVAGRPVAEELVRRLSEKGGETSRPPQMPAHLGQKTEAGAGEEAPMPGRSYAYLKISDGCDELCTFCAIPAIKGPYYSLPAAEILGEAEACLAEGARELVLVGQNTAIWRDGRLDLAGLIDLLAEDDRVRRIRVMYLQPEHVTEAFLEFMAACSKVCRYLDVPFQHAHPRLLRAMGRWGSGGEYLALLQRARRLMPDVAVRSAFIVGFPGEQDEHFEHLLSFVEEAGFDYGGGFIYSPEEGTAAARLRPRVAQRIARERLSRLNAALEASSEDRHRRMLGSRLEVMIDSLDRDEVEEGAVAVGRTAGQAPEVDGVTYIEGELPEGTRPGDVIEVTVSGTLGYDIVGTV